MKVQPDTTSYTVESLKVIKVLGDNDESTETIKVIKNYTKNDDVYFLVVREPPVDEITCPEDIKTVKKYKVAPYENRFAVRQEAIDQANKLWENIN